MKFGNLSEIAENDFLIVGNDFRRLWTVNDFDVMLDDQQQITTEFLFSFNELSDDRPEIYFGKEREMLK